MNDFLSIILTTFSLTTFLCGWLVWVFTARTQSYDWQPSPRSKVTPLGIYAPRR